MAGALAALLAWAARSIGPRVARLLLVQLLLVTLVGGVNSRLVGQLIAALQIDPDIRTGTLAFVALVTASARRPLRRALCPPSLAALRRQPIPAPGFAALPLPWSVPLAWPWPLVLGLGHPGEPAVAIAGWAVGALLACGVAAARSSLAVLARTLAALAAVSLVDRVTPLAWPILLVAGTLGVWLAGRDVRAALSRVTSVPAVRTVRRSRVAGTPIGALLALDRATLTADPGWLRSIWLPLLATGYAIVLHGNGNCRGTCLDGAAIVATTLGARLVADVLDTLRRRQGARLIAPDRVVPTRLRLASLSLVASLALAPFALPLATLARDVTVLPHACAVALGVLWLQLRAPDHAVELGPMVWLLAGSSAVVLLPPPYRFAASVAIALALAALIDRRGRLLRDELATGRRTGTRRAEP